MSKLTKEQKVAHLRITTSYYQIVDKILVSGIENAKKLIEEGNQILENFDIASLLGLQNEIRFENRNINSKLTFINECMGGTEEEPILTIEIIKEMPRHAEYVEQLKILDTLGLKLKEHATQYVSDLISTGIDSVVKIDENPESKLIH